MQKIFDALLRRLPAKWQPRLQPFFSTQFFIFLAVGAINTLSTAVFATVLDRLFPAGMENRVNFVLGYALGMVLSYFLNCRFTFRKKPAWKSFLRFPASCIPNFVFQYAFVWLFTVLALPNPLAYLLAAVLGVPVTFLTMKFFVY